MHRTDEDDTGKFWMIGHFAFRKTPEKVKTKWENGVPSFFQQMPLKAYNWPLSRNLLGIQTLFVMWERDDEATENSGEWCILEGKMLPISSAVRTFCTCQLEVETFVFFTGSFTEGGLWRTFLGKILLESQLSDITIPHIMPGKSRLLLVMKGEREACSVNRELEPRFSGCHPDVSQYKWAHLIFPVNFILESSQWA